MYIPESSNKTAVIFIGIPASGKSSFYHRYFSSRFEHINLDSLHTRNKESIAVGSCIATGKSFVVDNTNPSKKDRERYILIAKEAGYRVIAYFFQSRIKDCAQRNSQRGRKARVPDVALASISNKLEMPDITEGFDSIYFVKIMNNGFIVEPWKDDLQHEF